MTNRARRVLVNTRCLRKPLSGVQRYTKNLVDELGAKITTIVPAFNTHGSLSGHFWEQTILPFHCRNMLLWSPANVGPVAVTTQVLTLHDMSVMDHPEWFSRSFASLYHFLLPKLISRVQTIITDSEHAKSRILAHFKIREERIEVVPLAAGKNFRRASESEINDAKKLLGIHEPYLLAVGSIDPRKNLQRVVEAWSLVQNRLPDVSLIVVGGHSNVFRHSEFRRLPSRTTFSGRVDDAVLPALYSGAAAFLYPSLYEGFGLPVLEAMACGTPVLASSTTSIPEVAGTAAMLVNPENTSEIAEGILAILKDSAIQNTLRSRGIAQASKFSWARTADLTWDVLARACRE